MGRVQHVMVRILFLPRLHLHLAPIIIVVHLGQMRILSVVSLVQMVKEIVLLEHVMLMPQIVRSTHRAHLNRLHRPLTLRHIHRRISQLQTNATVAEEEAVPMLTITQHKYNMHLSR